MHRILSFHLRVPVCMSLSVYLSCVHFICVSLSVCLCLYLSCVCCAYYAETSSHNLTHTSTQTYTVLRSLANQRALELSHARAQSRACTRTHSRTLPLPPLALSLGCSRARARSLSLPRLLCRSLALSTNLTQITASLRQRVALQTLELYQEAYMLRVL